MSEQLELPPMNWARRYTCLAGHPFVPHRGYGYWLSSQCDVCGVTYSRDEWSEGAKRLLEAATVINTMFLGKRVKCDMCNKEIGLDKDRAYHLQKHFSKAISIEDSKYLTWW